MNDGINFSSTKAKLFIAAILVVGALIGILFSQYVIKADTPAPSGSGFDWQQAFYNCVQNNPTNPSVCAGFNKGGWATPTITTSPMSSIDPNDAYNNCVAGNPSHPELCDSLKKSTPSPAASNTAQATPSAATHATPSPAVTPTTVVLGNISPSPVVVLTTSPSSTSSPKTTSSPSSTSSPKMTSSPATTASPTTNPTTSPSGSAYDAWLNCVAGSPSHPELCDSLNKGDWIVSSPSPLNITPEEAYDNCLAGNPSHPELCDSLKPSVGDFNGDGNVVTAALSSAVTSVKSFFSNIWSGFRSLFRLQ